VPKASQIKDITYWFMGVAVSGWSYNEQSHNWCWTIARCLTAVMDVSLDLWERRWSILLQKAVFFWLGKWWSGHRGHSCSKQQHEAFYTPRL